MPASKWSEIWVQTCLQMSSTKITGEKCGKRWKWWAQKFKLKQLRCFVTWGVVLCAFYLQSAGVVGLRHTASRKVQRRQHKIIPVPSSAFSTVWSVCCLPHLSCRWCTRLHFRRVRPVVRYSSCLGKSCSVVFPVGAFHLPPLARASAFSTSFIWDWHETT